MSDLFSALEIGRRLASQDNRMTSNPIFLVQERDRHWNHDSSDAFAWVDEDYDEAPAEEQARLEGVWHSTGDEEIDGFSRVGYFDCWGFVTACLTEEGAKDFIRQEEHHLTAPRIYVASGYRNDEWAAVREHFKAKWFEVDGTPCEGTRPTGRRPEVKEASL